jgi:hypothetical protein
LLLSHEGSQGAMKIVTIGKGKVGGGTGQFFYRVAAPEDF